LFPVSIHDSATTEPFDGLPKWLKVLVKKLSLLVKVSPGACGVRLLVVAPGLKARPNSLGAVWLALAGTTTASAPSASTISPIIAIFRTGPPWSVALRMRV
jgi:hypothetical protein